MGDVKTIISTSLIGSAIHQFMSEISSPDNTYRKWYDIWNNIFVFPPEYTDLIDLVLVMDKKASLGTRLIRPGGNGKQYVPGAGTHYLYWKSGNMDCWNYIVFEKFERDDIFYVCYSTNRQMIIFEDVVERLFAPTVGMIRTISIDTSRGAPFPMFLDKTIAVDERSHQEVVLNDILKDWYDTDVKNKNRKVMLCGKRGTGKSYIGRLLSRRIAKESKSCMIRLYDDFNPSLPGVSVALLVLQYAKPGTPVILLIDEIDKHYEKALDGSHADRINVLVHTRDIPSFNKMLDMIGDSQNIIAIYTTEKSPTKLYKNKNYHSFMRKGRVDKFYNFKSDKYKNSGYSCQIIDHSNVPGYVDNDSDSESEESFTIERVDQTIGKFDPNQILDDSSD